MPITAARQPELISIDDYLAGELVSEIKHEYLGGYVYAMADTNIDHSRLVGSWLGVLYPQLREGPYESFSSQTKVRIRFPTQTRFYYPDGLVVRKSNPDDDTFQDEPIVVGEVVSEATRRIDENEKREAYLTIPSLQAYLLVETNRPRVTVYRRGKEGFLAEVYEGRNAVVPLKAIEAELPLAELYKRVEFADG